MEAYEVRPEGQRAVYFYAKTLAVHLYDTEEKAYDRYGKRCGDIFVSAQSLRRRYEKTTMLEAAIALEPSVAEAELVEITEADAADILWSVLQKTGDVVKGLPALSDVEQEDLYTVRLDRINTDEGKAVWERFPKQARLIIEKLIALGKSRYEEVDLKKVILDMVAKRELKTKQDPWRIFSYYAPLMGDHGFVYYAHKRHKLADHKANI